jgi:hypothetical protein
MKIIAKPETPPYSSHYVCVGYLGFLVGTEIIDEGNIMGHLDNLIT